MHPVFLFLFKCFIYPVGAIYALGFLIFLFFYYLIHPSKLFAKKNIREEPPKCLLDTSWGRHDFAHLKDIKLHYVENGNRNKKLMLLVHGFPEFWYSWRYQLKDLSKDYWVVALDLRGYGESDKPESKSGYKMRKVIEDIRQFVLSLGRQKFILVGHDWGGLLSWNFLDFHTDMVDKFVILSCPHHKTWTTMIATDVKQFINSWYCFFFQMPYLPETALSLNDYQKFECMVSHNENMNTSVTEEDVEAFKYMFSKKGALKSAINYYRANCGQLYLEKESPKAYPPGLMMFGENEEYLTLTFLNMAKQIIPNLQTIIIKGASHFMQQDRPIEVNNSIRMFLEEKF